MSLDLSIPSRQSAASYVSNAVFGDGASHYTLLVVLFGVSILGRQVDLLNHLPYFWFAPLMIVSGASGRFRPLLFGCLLCIVGAAYTAEIETNAELRDLLVSITTATLFLSGIGFIISYQSRRIAEARAETLVAEHMQRELNHRIKNLFSVVIALIKKRGRLAVASEEGDPHAPFDDLVNSVAAMARAHGIDTTQAPDGGFDLDHLIREIMSPYSGHWQTDRPSQIRIDGPSIRLPVRMLTPLALLLHELATNAVKYGALSSTAGQLDLSWSVFEDGEGQQFISLDWIETRKPDVALTNDQNNHGYGCRIIEAAVKQLDARMERRCKREGLSFSVTVPALQGSGR